MILSCPTMPGRCPDDARTMPGNVRKCPDDGRLFPVMFGEPVRPATALGVESGPTPRLSRAAERAMIKRHGHVKEKMFQNRRWRRRLQALLGRDLADAGPSAHPTVNIAET